MIRSASIMAVLLAMSASIQAQQTVVIDLNEKAEPFSEEDYAELLSCTLESHPDETKRYAEYHFNRRDIQTPNQNVADPDSKLAMPVISECYEFQNGKPIPFSMDGLIGDWAKHHGVKDTTGVQTVEEFSACAVKTTPGFAQSYINIYRSTSQRRVRDLSLLVQSMAMPPCSIRGDNIRLGFDELYRLIDKELERSRGKP